MMSQVNRKQLSTLIDGELDAVEMKDALGALTGDPELRAAWDRYHLIGDALRGERLSRGTLSVAQRVSKRLDKESVIPLTHRRTMISRNWLGPVAGSALAASVALVALVVGPDIRNEADSVPSPLAEKAPSEPTLYVDRTGTYWSLMRPEVESKLNSFLVNHQEYAPAAGMKGLLPYATFVSYDARR